MRVTENRINKANQAELEELRIDLALKARNLWYSYKDSYQAFNSPQYDSICRRYCLIENRLLVEYDIIVPDLGDMIA